MCFASMAVAAYSTAHNGKIEENMKHEKTNNNIRKSKRENKE